jgi:hypothetical protein
MQRLHLGVIADTLELIIEHRIKIVADEIEIGGELAAKIDVTKAAENARKR